MNLMKGYSYGITNVKKITVAKSLQGTLQAKELFMLRLRNPFGANEWSGPWSDK